MKGWIKWLMVIVVLSVAFHLVSAILYPHIVMNAVENLFLEHSGGYNRIHHAPPVDERSRKVVRPSPDLLYSDCVYDVSKGPVRIRARVPKNTYWSVSFYRSNTDNFFVMNDRQVKSDRVDIVLLDRGMSPPKEGSAKAVIAPSKRGVILFRTLIKDRNTLRDLIKLQKETYVEASD